MLSPRSLTSLHCTWKNVWRFKHSVQRTIILNNKLNDKKKKHDNPASMNPSPKTPMAARARFDLETLSGKKGCWCRWISLFSWKSFFLANVVQNLLLTGREEVKRKTLKLLPVTPITNPFSYLLSLIFQVAAWPYTCTCPNFKCSITQKKKNKRATS